MTKYRTQKCDSQCQINCPSFRPSRYKSKNKKITKQNGDQQKFCKINEGKKKKIQQQQQQKLTNFHSREEKKNITKQASLKNVLFQDFI